jgi:hypothetical protein
MRRSPPSSTRRSGPEPPRCSLRLASTALALGLVACAPATRPPPGDAGYCATLFDQLDAIEFGPRPGMVGFDFRQQQIARIQQAKCLTFTRDLEGLEGLGARLAPHTPPGGPALRPVAVQAGVVTNMEDAGRTRAFFEGLGYRVRTRGSPRLGTRVYVEARTAGQVEDIVAIAREAGFVGPYPSRFVTF